MDSIRIRLEEGNRGYIAGSDPELRRKMAEEGQHPYAIVICCSDSRVVPEQIFQAAPGELFVIRVAGNVLDRHQLGSIEYAAGHLDCRQIVVLGHTGCGAVSAALSGGAEGFIRYITENILEAAGGERDPYKVCCLNVKHAADRLRREFNGHPEIGSVAVTEAVYDIRSGEVSWL